MGEELLGWMASQSIGRLSYQEYKGGFGYGLFFTSNRLVGVSYKRVVSRALLPGHVIAVLSFALLGTLLTYFGVTRPPPDQTVPLWVGLLFVVMFGGWIVALIIYVYSGPKQIARRLQHEATLDIQDLTNQSTDLSLDRASIAQITVEGRRINVQTKSGEWVLFTVQDPDARGALTRVLVLFQRFCSLSPPISMFIKQKNQWTLVSKVPAS